MSSKVATSGRQEGPGDLRRTVRLFRRFMGSRRVYAAGVLLLVVEAATAVLEAYPIAYLIDFLQGVRPDLTVQFGFPTLLGSDRLGTILILTIAIIAIAAINSAADSLTEVCMARGGRSLGYGIRVAMYSHLQRLPLAYHDSKRTGDVLTRVTGDVLVLEEFVVGSISNILGSLLVLVGSFALLFYQSWNVALVALVVVPTLALVSNFYSRRIKTASKTQRSREGELASTTQEMLTSIRLVQSYGRGTVDLEKFSDQTAKSMRASLSAANIQAQFSFVIAIAEAIAICAVIWLGVWLVDRSALTIGTLILFILLLQNMFKPARKIVSEWYKIGKVFASVERIDDLLGRPVGVEDLPDARPAPALRGHLSFRNVTFAYPAEHEDGSEKAGRPAVLRNVTFDVYPGEVVSLSAPSGAGKSTVAQLIPRLYDPDAGEVRIDGIPLRMMTLASLRSQVSLVLQETMLLSGSVAENIGYGIPDATHEDIEQAARQANAHDFIMELPEGYETELGEKGSTLSGGQRQRIAIARAFIRQAPILILDEPTTGLDAESAKVVVNALRGLMRDKTTILITHDPSLNEFADRVLVLADGQIAGDVPETGIDAFETAAVESVVPHPPDEAPIDVPEIGAQVDTPEVAALAPEPVTASEPVIPEPVMPEPVVAEPVFAEPVVLTDPSYVELDDLQTVAASNGAAAGANGHNGNGHAAYEGQNGFQHDTHNGFHALDAEVEPTAAEPYREDTEKYGGLLDGLLERLPDVARALDRNFVARHVAPLLLDAGLTARDVTIEKLWLRSERTFGLRYRFRLADGSEHSVLASVHSDGRQAERYLDQRVAPLVAHGEPWWGHPWKQVAARVDHARLVVHAFPIDPGLPTLISASDPEVVGELVSNSFEVDVRPSVKLVRYPREGSCVLRYDYPADYRGSGGHEAFSLYGKIYADGTGLLVEGFLDALRKAQRRDRSATAVRYPAPVLFEPSLGLLLTAELAGESLSERISRGLAWADAEPSRAAAGIDLESSIIATGRALARLHDSDMATAPAHPVSHELDDLWRELQLVARTWPDIGADMLRHVDRLAEEAPTAPDLVLSHGDFTPSQVLIDDDRPAVVDLDGLCWADPARDLGRFVAQLDLLVTKGHGPRSRSIVDDLVGAFLHGYLEGNPRADHDRSLASRVEFYRRVSLVRSALHACRQLKAARLELVESLFASDGVPSGRTRP